MRHDPQACIADMLLAARRAVKRMGDLDLDAFLNDDDAQWYMFSQIVLIGEAANRIEREEQLQYPQIPWSAVISMRHRIVHGYDSIDWETVYSTVKEDLPELITLLEDATVSSGE